MWNIFSKYFNANGVDLFLQLKILRNVKKKEVLYF